MADKEKSTHFQNLNLCEMMSRVGESRVTYVNFNSPQMQTCINSGCTRGEGVFSLFESFSDSIFVSSAAVTSDSEFVRVFVDHC